MAERCQAETKGGKPCGATVVADGMCAWHAPSWEARRRQWSSKGGAARSNRARARRQLGEAMTLQEVQVLLGVALRAVLAGKLTPNVAGAAASLARAMTTVATASEFEARLIELEKAAGIERGRFPA